MANIAVIKTGGKQYKVQEGNTLKIEKIAGDKGGKIIFDKVLLLADEAGKSVDLGMPEIKGAKVEASILEQGRNRKIAVIKFKSKARYRRHAGHRQYFTKIKIEKIGK
ncbi:MAG: 50S ribosomal protein L21 [Patescibacteria group bacterium]|nr:50S ribosomal protein L21 [Patescibacteria group bacterium]MDD5490542.1 50S ribosomal protein L21 [Patescibacteria group bacterium]